MQKKIKNFSAHDFMESLSNAFEEQGLDNMAVVIDNVGAVVISNADTGEEVVIDKDTMELSEEVMNFLIENGLDLEKSKINFSEMTNFGAAGKISKSNNASKIYRTIEKIINKSEDLNSKISEIAETYEAGLDQCKSASSKVNFYQMLQNAIETLQNVAKVSNKLTEKLSKNDKLMKQVEGDEQIEHDDDKIEKALPKNDSKEKLQRDIRQFKSNPPKNEDERAFQKQVLLKRKENLGFSEHKVNFSIDSNNDKQKMFLIKIFKEDLLKDCEELAKLMREVYPLLKSLKLREKVLNVFNVDNTKGNNFGILLHNIKSVIELSKNFKETDDKDFGDLGDDSDIKDKVLNTFKSVFDDIDEEALKKIVANEKVSKYSIAIADNPEDKKPQNELATMLMKAGIGAEKVKELVKGLKNANKGLFDDDKDNGGDSNKDDPDSLENLFKTKKQNTSKEDEKSKAKDKYEDLLKALKDDKVDENTKKQIKEQAEKLKEKYNFSEEKKYTTFSEHLNDITSKYTTNFDAHQVHDSELGNVWEDKFGSLWSENPDEKANAECLWESADGKEQPSGSLQGDSLMSEDEMNDSLGMVDTDNAPADDDGGSDDLDLGGDEDDDLDLGGDEDSESDDLDLGDDSGDEGGDDLDFSESDSEDDLDLDDNDSDDDELNLDLDSEEDSNDDDDLDLDLDSTDSEDDLDLNLEEDSNDNSDDDAISLQAAKDTIKQLTPIIEKLIDKIH